MAALMPWRSSTRQHPSKGGQLPPPLELKLQETTPLPSQTESNSSSNSLSSILEQDGPLKDQKQQPEQHQASATHPSGATSPDPHTHTGMAQFQSPNTALPYPSYRPYTPTTPTTPTTNTHTHSTPATAIHMAAAASAAAAAATASYPASPRIEHSGSFSSQSGKPLALQSLQPLPLQPLQTLAGGLYPYSKGQQRGANSRRVASNESSLYDPYRSRQPGVSAKRVKSDYQSQSPIREHYPSFPQQAYSGYSSSEELHQLQQIHHASLYPLSHPHHHHHQQQDLADELALEAMMHPPPPPPPSSHHHHHHHHREDYYRASPTLSASQTLAATYANTNTATATAPSTLRADSPFQTAVSTTSSSNTPYLPYQSYQPYSGNIFGGLHHPLPSPGLGFSGYLGISHEDRPVGVVAEQQQQQKLDPYRSAYSHHHQNHGSPKLHEDLSSSSFESRLSGGGGGGSVGKSLQETSQTALLSMMDENRTKTSIGLSETNTNTTAANKKDGMMELDPSQHHPRDDSSHLGEEEEGDGTTASVSGTAAMNRGSSHPSQPSKTDSTFSGHHHHKTGTTLTMSEEDEENEVILQKLGVLSSNSDSGCKSGGTRSGFSHQSSGKSSSGRHHRDHHHHSHHSHGKRSRLSLGHYSLKKKSGAQWSDDSDHTTSAGGGLEERAGGGSPGDRNTARAAAVAKAAAERRRRLAQRKREANRCCWCWCCSCSTRTCLGFTLLMCVALAVSLFFVVPRTPEFFFEAVSDEDATGVVLPPPMVSSREIRERFSMRFLVDNQANYLPLRFNRVELSVTMRSSSAKIMDNNELPSAFVIGARSAELIIVPMVLDYTSFAADPTQDKTFQRLIRACTPIDSDKRKSFDLASFSSTLDAAATPSGATTTQTNSNAVGTPASFSRVSSAEQVRGVASNPGKESMNPMGINLTITGTLHIWGLDWIWKPEFSMNVDNVPCPVNAEDLNPGQGGLFPAATDVPGSGGGARGILDSGAKVPVTETDGGRSVATGTTFTSATVTVTVTSSATEESTLTPSGAVPSSTAT